MRDDGLRRNLTAANPWWQAAAKRRDPADTIRDQRLLRDRAEYDLEYRSLIFADIERLPVGGVLVVLTGPRRVGKTVALLDLASAFCQREDMSAFQVIYMPCDGMRDRDLRRSLTLGRELTRPADVGSSRPRVWLLDEVSNVSGWSSIIKLARDGTAFGDDTVIVTGSRWRDGENVEANLMAGRAGSTGGRRNRHLLPMTFRDFLVATRPSLALPASVHPSDLQAPHVRAALENLQFQVDDYDLAWQDFLTCGGFPRAVAEHHKYGAASEDFLRDIAASLRGDLQMDGPPQSLPILLSELETRSSSPLNIANLALSLSWTRATTEGRLNRLVSSFGAVWCRQYSESGRNVQGSQSKLYLVDPVLSLLPSRLRAGLPTPDMTRLTEAMLGATLARSIDLLDQGRWVAADTIGYVRTDSGNEIDLGPVDLPAPGGTRRSIPIEAKWVDDGWRAEARVLTNKYGSGVLATKSILNLDYGVWAIPAPLVALLLI